MSEDGRKVFSMETALGVFAGQNNPEVCDMLTFALGRSVCECCAPVVAPMVRGWLMSQNPELGKLTLGGGISFATWVSEVKGKLGDNISMPAIPEADAAAMRGLLDFVEEKEQFAENQEAIAEAKQAELDAAQKEIKVLTPFKAKTEELEKKVASLEEKNKAAQAEVNELKGKLAAFDGKVAINENEIEKSVKDIVKKAVGSMSFAGAAAAGAAGEEAAVEETAAEESSGGVPDTFGFGTSGASDDGFGF